MKTIPLELSRPGFWDNTPNDGDSHLNMYPQKCRDKWRLTTYPGLKLFATTGNNLGCRGAHHPAASQGPCYSVHGTRVYRVYAGVATLCTGALDAVPIANMVEMCSNLTHMLIVDGLYGYYMDFATETVTKITDVNFPSTPITCAFLNSRFIVCGSGTDTFYESQLDTPINWTPIIFAEADVAGDQMAGIIAGGDRLHMLGDASYQVFYPSEGSNPFTNVSGSSLSIGGIKGSYNWAYFKDALYFMGSNSRSQYGQVFRIMGGILQKISTPAIENFLNGTSGFYGYCYTYQGQDFYELIANTNVVGAPSAVYNITTDAWVITTSTEPGYYTKRRLRAVINTPAGVGYPLGFDYFNGKIYTLRPDYNTEDGQLMYRSLSFVVELTNDTVFHQNLRIALELKLDSLSTFNFTALLRWSNDGGATYNAGTTFTRTITGTTAQKVIASFENLGSSIGERRYNLVINDFPGSITVRSADITLDKGGF